MTMAFKGLPPEVEEARQVLLRDEVHRRWKLLALTLAVGVLGAFNLWAAQTTNSTFNGLLFLLNLVQVVWTFNAMRRTDRRIAWLKSLAPDE